MRHQSERLSFKAAASSFRAPMKKSLLRKLTTLSSFGQHVSIVAEKEKDRAYTYGSF
jgi:hypothetical protein